MAAVNLALGTRYSGTGWTSRTPSACWTASPKRGTLIDTADCYTFWSDASGHGGQSETVIGRWLKRRPGVRDRVVLSTKAGLEPGDTGEWPGNRLGLSAPAVRAAAHGSLRRLGTDRTDVYGAHGEDRRVPLVETVRAIAELEQEGTAVRLGVSRRPLWRVERARQPWVYTPLLSGACTRAGRRPPEAYEHRGNERRLAALGKVAAELGPPATKSCWPG